MPLRPSLDGRPAGRLLRLWRYTGLALLLLQGALTVLCVYPFVSLARRETMRANWSRRILALLGVQLEVAGHAATRGSMLVSNHISWLDILVLNAFTPARFVSKAEVRNWPVIGWLAARNGTIFLRRGSRGHARQVNGEIARNLQGGHIVAVFPEGTTTDGSTVLGFHAALLQPAIDAACPVQGLALRYRDLAGDYTRIPAYDGDLSLGESMAAIIGSRGLRACITLQPPRATATGTDRRALARALHEEIQLLVEHGHLPHSRPAAPSPAPQPLAFDLGTPDAPVHGAGDAR